MAVVHGEIISFWAGLLNDLTTLLGVRCQTAILQIEREKKNISKIPNSEVM